MYKNVIILLSNILLFLCSKSGDTFRFFSSDTGTYKEARPFFTSSKNLIDDYFDGSLAQLSSTVHAHTFVFAMYYASFCGISRRMRDPFEKAASFYRERLDRGNVSFDKHHVKFIAINCFFHTGECRKSYKLDYFPYMLLYVKGTRAYQYFGPAILSNLIEFIERIRMPMIRLVNVDEFLDFAVQHETAIIGRFDFSNDTHRRYHSLFVQTAMKHIEYDNEHPVRFAVALNRSISNKLSQLYSTPFESPFIILHRLNSSPQAFPNMTNNFTIENLFQWINLEHKNPSVGWIVPHNRYYSRSPSIDKASVSNALIDHDSLLIFLTSTETDELKLREIYFHLSNCNHTYSHLWMNRAKQFYKKSLLKRKIILNDSKILAQHQQTLSSCCKQFFLQMSTINIYHLCLSTQDLFSFQFLQTINNNNNNNNGCLPFLFNTTLQRFCYRDYCRQWLKNYMSIFHRTFEKENEDILEKRRDRLYDQSIGAHHRTIDESIDLVNKYEGFMCRINTTWAFRLINTRYYPNFGRNIGVNSSRAIVVLQAKNEQHFVLNDEEINTHNIYRLIYDIQHNLRARSLATNPPKLRNRDNGLVELTTDTFESIVFDPHKYVLVVYYTKWCGFCQSIWSPLFQTKQFFNKLTNLTFARIQADKHDLPWHLTVFNYPTVILFPSKRKHDSIVFPTSSEPITAIRLIKFLFANIFPDSPFDRDVHRRWCTNNETFASSSSSSSSSYVDFSQLSHFVSSFS